MAFPRLSRSLLPAVLFVSARIALATDLRLDVATDNNSGDDKAWFGSGQLVNLNFRSVNGHDIEQGSNAHQSAITSQGNTLGVYYDYFHTLYPSNTPTQAVTTIQNWIKGLYGGNAEKNAWLALNEIDSSTWNGASGDDYRSWLVSTINGLHTAGYSKIVLFSPQYIADNTYTSTWQSLAANAYIGAEMFIDGQTVANQNFYVPTLQSTYQNWYNMWVYSAGVPASKLMADEHFSVNLYDPSHYWGANGVSGAQWQAVIEARDIAIHNIPFGGFIGYAWDKNAQATGDPTVDLANQISYERAYASTLVTQTEIPTWTGNDGTTSWADYLNWTGGLPSTTSAPFPLLASSNPNLPRQTSANFYNLPASTIITLDGNQSATNLLFSSSNAVTIAPGTGGSLTMTGPGASISTNVGSHSITAPLVINSNTSANLTGNLTLSGGLTNNGTTLTKSGAGSLTISGTQVNAPSSVLSIVAGAVSINSDSGSSSSANLSISASGGTTTFNAAQHLASLSLTGGSAALRTAFQSISTNSLTINTATSTLDLAQNDLFIHYTGTSPLSAIIADLQSAYDTGKWDGRGIQSSAVASHPHTSLAYAEASTLLGLSGSQTATFDGQTVDSKTIIIKYTWVGDANLDGLVNSVDLAMTSPTGTIWQQGDFDYNNKVDANDTTLYQQGLLASSGQNINPAAVPEPAVLSLLLLTPFLRRQSRRPLSSA